jgi:hypothetical protein
VIDVCSEQGKSINGEHVMKKLTSGATTGVTKNWGYSSHRIEGTGLGIILKWALKEGMGC